MKNLIVFLVLFNLAASLFSIVPAYFGARSLSLGYSTTALNFDVNAIHINPALLAAVKYGLSGYQYQNSFMDYKNFAGHLDDILGYNLKNFESFPTDDKKALLGKLHDLFRSKNGLYGFSSSVPGYISRGYGVSYAIVNTAVINPLESDIFNKEAGNITNDDIASLGMNFLGLHYKQVSLSYGMSFSRGMNVGVTLHYLDGELTEYNASITDENVFTADTAVSTYLEDCWGQAADKFSRVTMDFGISVNFGAYFNVGVSVKNTWNPKIQTANREITLNKRVTAGLAFTPEPQWGIYLDLDIAPTDLLFSGEKMQPLSVGIEKGFFRNKFFLRAGFLTDLTGKYFIGEKSDVLYGLGCGFNLGSIIVDAAIGLDGSGSINNLAISGFFILK
ncbi:MAG: conjugal transfer protein TraF [Candidatus Aminicenantes bacterium]|nr:conjugal transfer protein TraF [Candidatus Aminicenantes bacterium]